MSTTHHTSTTQPQTYPLETVRWDDGSICIMSTEQLDSWNAATLQQAARITDWNTSRSEFTFAPEPAYTHSRLSYQAARAAAVRALRRCEASVAAAHSSNSGAATTSSANLPSQNPMAGQSTIRRRPVPSRPSPHPSDSQDWPASRLETSSAPSGHNASVLMFLLVLILIFTIFYMGKAHFTREPASRERLGQLLMEGVCKDISVRGCMELVKDGRIRRGRWS